jgi:hypothetical protein
LETECTAPLTEVTKDAAEFQGQIYFVTSPKHTLRGNTAALELQSACTAAHIRAMKKESVELEERMKLVTSLRYTETLLVYDAHAHQSQESL